MTTILDTYTSHIDNIPHSTYITTFITELHLRVNISPERMNQLEILIVKLISPQFLELLISQMKIILADNKITSADIPSIMIIIANLLDEQLPKLRNTKFHNNDIKDVIIIVLDCLIEKGLSKMTLSQVDKETLHKLIDSWFQLIINRIMTPKNTQNILNFIYNFLTCKSCRNTNTNT